MSLRKCYNLKSQYPLEASDNVHFDASTAFCQSLFTIGKILSKSIARLMSKLVEDINQGISMLIVKKTSNLPSGSAESRTVRL